MFPQLKGIEYEYRWAGRIAITRNFLPHVHLPADGMTIALGYNGRGIAMATTLGKHLAALIGGTTRGSPRKSSPFARSGAGLACGGCRIAPENPHLSSLGAGRKAMLGVAPRVRNRLLPQTLTFGMDGAACLG